MAGVLRCLGIVLLAVLLAPSAAMGHTNSVETSPEHGAKVESLPAEATITFGEPPTRVDVVLAKPDGEIDVLTPRVDGSRVTVDLPASGPRGDYGLSYRVVSADGHPVSGSVTFSVTSGPQPTATPTVLAEAPTGPTSDETVTTSTFPLLAGVGLAAVLLVVVLLFVARRKRVRA